MKKIVNSSLSIPVIALLLALQVSAQEAPRTTESFNQGWKFIRYFNSSDDKTSSDREPASLQLPQADDSGWRDLDLPHDWAIEGPFHDSLENNTGLLPWKGIGWYRKHFIVPESDMGKRIYVGFDGAMANAEVWLNGKYAGEWPYGYTSFQIDLTPFVVYGKENIIAVRLDTKNWDSRWYPGAGIYRNTWLIKTSPVHLAYNGVFCTTPEIKKERGIVSIRAEVENHYPEAMHVTVKAAVYKLGGSFEPGQAPVAESSLAGATIQASRDHD
ncbi:MAG: beta galactosidase jelly roll domain-containing protein, partial [Bacteroidales bacterium]|nr:beta galactosidase jelly roll domain-containing protein [Bacteroidales bacterium]